MKQTASNQRLLRRVVIAIISATALMLGGCGESVEEEILMPAVEGLTLDIALSDLTRAGYDEEPEIVGGGTFGPVNESNWVVCSQMPGEGEPIAVQPRLVIERSCEDGTEGESAEDESAAEDDSTPEAEEETPEPTEESPVPTEESPSPTVDAAPAPSGPTAQEVEAKYLEHLGSPSEGFGLMCDDYYTHWSCFYQGVAGTPSDFLIVNLLTDGGWSDADLEYMAQTAGLHWFNFIGCDFPQIDTIVVNVNGIDHNIPRYSVPDLC